MSDRPSIAELQRLLDIVRAADHINNAAAAILVAWTPVLLEIAAAALAWAEHPHGDNYQRLASALHRVRP